MKYFLLLPLILSTLACGGIGFIEDPAPLSGQSYWAAETNTPIPTVTIFLGMTTPVIPATPTPETQTSPPDLITTTPFWTTVTATPIVPPATATPWGFTATPFWTTTTPEWVTTTPDSITTTPVPPWTTTPALPQIGFTTPVPLDTPYYRIGTFYMDSNVYIGSPNGLVLRLTNHTTAPSPNNEDATYHYLTVQVTNYTNSEQIVPVADLFFIRHVINDDGETLTGRWVAQTEPLLAANLPAYETQHLTPIPPNEQNTYHIGFVTPNGEVEMVGLITNWNRPIEGGIPIWFYLKPDPTGSFISAHKPPPPTSVIYDESGTYSGGTGAGGGQTDNPNGIWPTTGTITRGFGCQLFYTGIDGSGWGCPAETPWFHNGVDIANVEGTPIVSPINGNLLFAGNNPAAPDCSDIAGSQPPHQGLGNYQQIGDGNTLHYLGHLSQFLLTTGAVSAGEGVSEMGSTGCSTGSHLHWTVYQSSSLIDPAIWAGPGP